MRRRKFMIYAGAAAGALLVNPLQTLARDKERSNEKMKIVVMTGSPRNGGNSSFLADEFIRGAQENGHEVFRFDCAHKNINPCRACNRCGMNGNCIFNDDFSKELRPKLIEADMVVFVTPMYYFGFSAQIKRAIDRFYAINGKIKGAAKKTAFLMTYANTADSEAEPMRLHYKTLASYLGWKDMGMVIAPGVWTAGSIRHTNYGDKAYELGKSI